MARPLRVEYPGATYHVTSRGNAGQPIFLDAQDRTAFLEVLADVVARFRWHCHAYCLMDNHYHLVLETPEANLSRGMRQLNGVYTQRFNRRHGRSGHLLQGRFKAILVEKESHLLEVARYVVLNPVRAGEVRHPRQWRWSSYRATAGEAPVPEFLTVDWLLSQFGRGRQAQLAYRQFVAQGRGVDIWEDLEGGVILGTGRFVNKMRPRLRERAGGSEIPKKARLAGRPTLKALFRGVRGDLKRRNERIREAVVEHGYTLNEVGAYIGLHYSTISRIVTRLERGAAESKDKI
ncbi:transposase [Candidatus Bipolaricaulota bacterium]|nr:transposase [Candidatus Bipolaricaulota bacterium]